MKVLSNWRAVRLWETQLERELHQRHSLLKVAFSYTAARTAVRVSREGWLTAAVRLTWKPLLGALACALLLGASIDPFLPEANSLPEALRLLRAS